MSASVFSSSWYRVSDLVPRLRAHAEIHRRLVRGQREYLLQDHASGKFHRLTPAAYGLIGLMDGRRSLSEIWNLASEELGDDLPSQDETIRLLAQLYRANALLTDAVSDVSELVHRGTEVRRKEFWANYRSPLAIRIPLWDPDRFLSAALPWVRPWMSSFGAALWIVVVGSALLLAGQHWEALSEGVGDRVLAADNLMVLWLTFPLVKILHEFGHGFAVKQGGGEVHEIGVMFLVGVPVPYVDASSSSAFASKWQRAWVGAAGVAVELLIAAGAMFFWSAAEPGLARAIAFNVMLIAGVSSLFFNGNPFLRFDAYYVVSDLLEIPNLGTRADRHWGYLIQKYLFGRADAERIATAPREGPWLAAYSVGAFVNRVLITLSIALFVASELFFVGVLIASWSISQFAILPLYRRLKFVLFDPQLRMHRRRALAWTGGAGLFLGIALFVVPAPNWTLSEGIVWAPEESIVRARTDGELESYRAARGSAVEVGTPLVTLRDADLVAEHAVALATLHAGEAQYALDRTVDRVQAEISRQTLEHARRGLARVEEDREALDVTSPARGTFLVQDDEDQIGRFVHRGDVLGYVLDFDPVVVRVVVPESAIDLVRSDTQSVEVRFAEDLTAVHPAVIVTSVPAATKSLPSAALSQKGGGEIALDPSAGGELEAYQAHFLLDLEVEGLNQPLGVGGRVYVRFEHAPEPAGFQFYRAARRLFLSRFNV